MIGQTEKVYICPQETHDSKEVDKISLHFEGVKFDRHFGRTKFAGGRERFLEYGSEMLNLRLVSLVAKEELDSIANDLGLEEINAEDLGANILISGIDNFTQLPIGTMLKFKYGACIMLTGDNFPCHIPGRNLDKKLETKNYEGDFAKVAMHKRGHSAIVVKPGKIKPGYDFEVVYTRELKAFLDHHEKK